MKALHALLGVAVAIGAGTATADHHEKNIVETAVAAGNFETLVAAAKAAGLAETLQGEGPFTVFAPTDEAFAKLPKGTVQSLLESPDKLQSILLYHVAPGKLMAKDVTGKDSLTSASGQPLSVSTADGVMVGGAKVVKADIAASNGVIHVIDRVLLPRDLVGLAESAGQFTTLLAALNAAGLSETLQGDGPFTVFAPTDAAFAALPKSALQDLLKPENKEKLKAILMYHVVPGRVTASDVVGLDEAKTAQGSNIDIQVGEAGGKASVKVDDATVVKTDLLALNGVIHVIDKVVMPKS